MYRTIFPGFHTRQAQGGPRVTRRLSLRSSQVAELASFGRTSNWIQQPVDRFLASAQALGSPRTWFLTLVPESYPHSARLRIFASSSNHPTGPQVKWGLMEVVSFSDRKRRMKLLKRNLKKPIMSKLKEAY